MATSPRMKYRCWVTADKLRTLLNYNPETGKFTWLIKPSIGTAIGATAGSLTRKGYIHISIGGQGKQYCAHRLAWLYVTGKWPKDQIDHINGVRHDNRFSNLREASSALNGQNRHGAQSNNKSGMLGVSQVRAGKYRATIRINQKKVHLGYFTTPQKAHAAYVTAKRNHGYISSS